MLNLHLEQLSLEDRSVLTENQKFIRRLKQENKVKIKLFKCFIIIIIIIKTNLSHRLAMPAVFSSIPNVISLHVCFSNYWLKKEQQPLRKVEKMPHAKKKSKRSHRYSHRHQYSKKHVQRANKKTNKECEKDTTTS